MTRPLSSTVSDASARRLAPAGPPSERRVDIRVHSGQGRHPFILAGCAALSLLLGLAASPDGLGLVLGAGLALFLAHLTPVGARRVS